MAGKDRKISELAGGLPDVSIALGDWEVVVKANYITQEIEDGIITNKTNTHNIKAVMQPLRPEALEIKPEGQRSWEWQQLHVNSKYPQLKVEQVISIKNQPYKIMNVYGYENYGYVEYHIIKDYK